MFDFKWSSAGILVRPRLVGCWKLHINAYYYNNILLMPSSNHATSMWDYTFNKTRSTRLEYVNIYLTSHITSESKSVQKLKNSCQRKPNAR